MNPTLSTYMLHANFYISEKARNNNIDHIYEENSYEYNSDEGVVKLPVKILNTLFIDRTHSHWAFGLDEEAKETVGTRSGSQKIVYHKIYRAADYYKEFADELPAGVVFAVNTKKLSEQPPYKFPVESLQSDCDVANAAIKELADKCDGIIANPENIFQDIALLAHYALTETRTKMNEGCSAQFNPGRDDKEFKEVLKKMNDEMTYLTNATTFIVK
ncbi:hypothetical protein D0T85_04130 [Bacteroides sp. 519]|nr:hypothetical protein [Bacteroides sp. 519]